MLPLVDEHVIRVEASVLARRAAMSKVAHRIAERPPPRLFSKLWRLETPTTFRIAEETPDRITLAGGHRFSRYELVFEIVNDEVHARTLAEFPGLRGRAYRALVIGSGGHALIVRAMLRKIRQHACQS